MFKKYKHIALLIIILLLLTATSLYAQQRYELTTLRNTNLERIELAKSQLGVREEKNPAQIRKYLASVNIYSNAAWCQAFQFWLMDSICNKLKIVNPLPQSGLAISSYNYAKKVGIRTQFIPQAGDLLVWKTEGKWTGHVALIVQVKSEKSVITIEGNTSSKSVRTGGAVERKERLVNHPIGKLLVYGIVGFNSQNEQVLNGKTRQTH